MKIAHLADIHLTTRGNDSGETLDEQVARLTWIGEDAEERGAEAMLVAGDFFDRIHGSNPDERNAALQVVAGWADSMPVVIAYGNHDAPGDLDYLAKMRTRRQVSVYSRPGIWGKIDTDLAVACLPWPRKSQLVADMGSVDKNEIDNVAKAAMRSILAGFGAAFQRDARSCVLLAHAELGAAAAGTSDYDDPGQPMVGRCDIDLCEADLLASGADVICLGHIHRFQVIGDRIVYAGSPRQTTFGEDKKKGYCLIDVGRGRPPIIEHIQAPGRELVTLSAVIGEDGSVVSAGSKWPVPDSAIVRLRYDATESQHKMVDEAMRRYAEIDLKGRQVKMDPRIRATTRVRSESMSKASTNAQRLDAWWGEALDKAPPRCKQVLSKLSEIEAEVGL